MSKELKIKGGLTKDFQQIYIGDEPTGLFINSEGRFKNDNFKPVINSDGKVLEIVSEDVIDIKPSGNLLLNADTVKLQRAGITYGKFYSIASALSGLFLYEKGGASTDDSFGIAVLEHGETNIFTIDAGGAQADITINPDGDLNLYDVVFKTAPTFEAGVEYTTPLVIKYDGSNYTTLAVTSAGALSITGTGTADSFTIDFDKAIVLDSLLDSFAFKDNGTTRFAYSAGDFIIYGNSGSTLNLFVIDVNESGETNIATSDSDGTLGHLKLAPDGDLILDPVSHIIQVLDNTIGFTQTEPTFDATDTIVDFADTGNKQKLTLTNNVTDIHFKFPQMSGNFICVILQDGTGGRTVSNWKSNSSDGTERTLLWAGGTAPSNTETAGKADIASFYWDADNNIAYGTYTYNF